MANKQTIVFDIQAEISQVKQSAQEMRNIFEKMDLSDPLRKSFSGTFTKLERELRNIEVIANKGLGSLSDTKKAETSIEKINDLFEDLKIQMKDMQKFKIDKIVSSDTVKKLKNYKSALEQAVNLQKRDNSQKIKKAKEAEAAAIEKVAEAQKKVNNNETKKSDLESEQTRLTKQINDQTKAIEDLAKERQKLAKISQSKRTGEQQAQYTTIKTDYETAEKALSRYKNDLKKVEEEILKNALAHTNLSAALQEAQAKQESARKKLEEAQNAAVVTEKELNDLKETIHSLGGGKIDELPNDLKELEKILLDLDLPKQILKEINKSMEEMAKNSEATNGSLGRMKNKANGAREMAEGFKAANTQVEQLKSRLTYFFSAMNGFQLFKRAIRDAYNSIKELDAAMTEMAVVTDYSISDIWGNIKQYTTEANELGATTKDVINSMVLYTQQGLEMSEATQLSTETMKMARIASLEGAEATDLMTAALRGFNMELNDTSAQRVNDVYSNLAANAAANTQEIADAMTRTASIANAAGMEFETTAAFLTQMIETTRESAENLGTAMKTIVARFTEMKKSPNEIIDVEGEEVSANKVEAALKSVGVQLRDTNGEFRNLDDVFLDLSSKWDSLDKMSQRYVATTAAGSRQQSRFIAMMDNYQRTMELVDYATNSAGASQRQFEKTMDSLESKLNRLHNAWEQFTTGLANQSAVKGIVDLLTNLLTTVNNLTDALDPLHTGWSKILTAFLGFKAAKKGVNAVLQGIGAQMGTRGATEEGENVKRLTTKDKWENKKANIKEKLFGNGKENWEAQNKADEKAANSAKEAAKAENTRKEKEEELAAAIKKKEEADREATKATKKATQAEKDKIAADQNVNTTKKEKSNAQRAHANAYRKAERTNNYDDLVKEAEAEERLTKASEEASKAKEAQRVATDNLATATQEVERTTTAAEEAQAAVTAAETQVQNANTISNEANAQSERDAAAAEGLRNTQSKVGIISRIKAIALATVQTGKTKAETLAKYGLITAEEKEAITKGEMTLAQVSFNTALLTCPITWIVAGLAALAAIAIVVAMNMDTTEKKAKRLDEAVGQLGDQLNESQEALNDLKSSWENLQTLKDELKELTAGTDEWKSKIIEINQETLKLLEQFPKLTQYLSNNNGLLEISPGGYDELLQEQQRLIVEQQGTFAFGEAMKSKTDKKLLEENLSNDRRARSITEELSKKQEIDEKDLETKQFFRTAISALAQDFNDKKMKIGESLTEEQMNLISTVAVSDKTLNYFEKIMNETKADVKEYAKLTGLTETAVEKKKEQGELDEQAIKIRIATNKFEKEYSKKTEKLLKLSGKISKDNILLRLLEGQNSLTVKDIDGKKNPRKVFSKFIKDGEVKIENEDEAKSIFSHSYGIDINLLNEFTKAGASIQEIIENLLNNRQDFEDFDNTIANFGTDLQYFSATAAAFEKTLGQELSVEMKKQLSEAFKKVKDQNGDLQAFSTQLNSIISQFKNEDDLKNFLKGLKDIDFSSETKVRDFADGLKDFGIIINDNVKKQLVEATNAAKDFSLDEVIKQLRDYELADKVSEMKEKGEREIKAKDYEDYANFLTTHGHEDYLKEKFIPRGANYVFTGDYDELKDMLLADEATTEAEKNLEKARTKYTQEVEQYKKALEVNIPETERKNIWDTDEFKGYKNENIDTKSPEGYDENYLNSLLYRTSEDGTILTFDPNNITPQTWGSVYDKDSDDLKIINTALVDKIMSWVMEDAEERIKYLPKQFFEKVFNSRTTWKTVGEDENVEYKRYGTMSRQPTDEWYNGESGELLEQILAGKKEVHPDIAEKNKAYLEQIQGIYPIITDEEVEVYKTKSRQEIENFLKSKAPSVGNEQEYLERVEEGQYTGLSDANEIIDLIPKTIKGYKAQNQALQALNMTHSNYAEKIQETMKAQKCGREEAERYLAVEYQMSDANNDIVEILEKNKEMLSDDELLASAKGNQDYSTMLTQLAEKFQKIFVGEKVDNKWVEDNLDLIRQMTKGGNDAVKAWDTMKAKYKDSLPTIRSIEPGDANGELSEKFLEDFNKLESWLSEPKDVVEKDINEIETYFKSLQKILDDVDGSEVSIDVKQNDRAKIAENLKLYASELVAARLAAEKPEDIAELDAKLMAFKKLAADNGFLINIPNITESTVTQMKSGEKGPSMYFDNTTHTMQSRMSAEEALRKVANDNMTVQDVQGSTGKRPNWNVNTSKTEKTQSESKDHFWANDYDKQYNLLKKIEALERKRVDLERDYNKLLKKRYLTEEELKKNKKQQVEFLNQQADINRQLRDQSLSYLRGMGNGDIWFDENLGTLVTNPNVANYNEDQMKVFNDTKSKMESFYSNWQSASSNLDTIYDSLEELTEKAEFTIDDIVANVTRASTIIEHTLTNLDREIERLKRYDSGATTADFQKRYEQTMQTLVDKYNNKTEEIALQEQNVNKMIYGEIKDYVEYDWDSREYKRTAKYYGMTDPDFKDRIDKDIAEFDTAIDRLNELDNEREETRDAYYDKLHEVLDSRLEFEEKVYNAVVQGREKEIEALENIDNSISSAASDLISSVQKNLQKMRQDRQNAKTEEELQNMEARLAYLQVDTSNANQKSVLDLQKQLTDKQQSYTDSLIDQKISELQQQNDEAAQQRKRQIEIMKTQLELDKQNGVIWKNVNDAILHGVDTSGRIQKDSELYNLLSSLDEVSKKSATQLERWYGELSSLAAIYRINTGNFVSDKQMKDWLDNPDSLIGENGPYITALKSALEAMNRDGEYDGLIWYDQEGQQVRTRYDNYIAKDQHDLERYRAVLAEYQALAQELANLRAFYARNEKSRFTSSFARQYDSGGLADYTGPAWLDGTPSSPELVLNQRDTKNFIQLKDILSNIMNGKSSKNDTNGDFYFEIHIDVDKISNDYDVDKIAERIKQQITNEARYRNVNTINMIR